MAYTPISAVPIQYSKSDGTPANGYYLKFYLANSATPISMQTDAGGATSIAKAKLNESGYPISNPNDENTVFIPHLSTTYTAYRFVLYASAADADANNVTSGLPNIQSVEINAAISATDDLRADLAASSGASLLGFIQAGTGAVASTVQTELRKIVDVKQFGAVGDGVTDDTAAIQRGIDYLGTLGGGLLVIPPSSAEYVVNLRYQIPTSSDYHESALWIKDNVTIYAQGATIKGKINTHTHGGFVSFSTRENAHVFGGTWIGDKMLHTLPLPTGEWCFAFTFSASKKCTLKNAYISDSRGDGAYIGGTPSATFDSTKISYDIEVTGCQIINCGRNGISVVGAQRYTIANNIITGTWGYAPQAGIDVEPNYTYSGNWGAVDGSITGNVVTENYGDGITLFRSNGLTVTGNTITRNGERGISLRGGVYEASITGNVVKYAGLRASSDSDSWYGLYMDALAGGYGDAVFSGNTIDSAKCFNVISDANSNIKVSGNHFGTSADAALLWGAQGTGSANTNSYFTSYIVSVDADGTTFTDNSYRVTTNTATWRGASSYLISVRKSNVLRNIFYNINSTGGIYIRLDDNGNAPGRFHENICNDNLSVGQTGTGWHSASNVDFSRSYLNNSEPSKIFVKTNSPSIGWVAPANIGDEIEFSYGVVYSANTYRFKVWDGSAWKYVGQFV